MLGVYVALTHGVLHLREHDCAVLLVVSNSHYTLVLSEVQH